MVVPAQPQLVVASDGSLAALHEAGRISLIEVPGGAVFAEIAVDPEAAASEIAWVGAPPRLLVLSRYATHSTVHMLDPAGPRSIAEIRLELPMRLAVAVGHAALVIGQLGAAVLATSDSHVLVYPFSTRSVPLAAGAAGAASSWSRSRARSRSGIRTAGCPSAGCACRARRRPPRSAATSAWCG
jgi:hypothetical protein